MGSIQVRWEKDSRGRLRKGPYAYYVTTEKVNGKHRKIRRYLGKVPPWYADLFSREVIEYAKSRAATD